MSQSLYKIHNLKSNSAGALIKMGNAQVSVLSDRACFAFHFQGIPKTAWITSKFSHVCWFCFCSYLLMTGNVCSKLLMPLINGHGNTWEHNQSSEQFIVCTVYCQCCKKNFSFHTFEITGKLPSFKVVGCSCSWKKIVGVSYGQTFSELLKKAELVV